MSAAELADALSASRSKAIAALGRAYVRRDDEPDDDLFRGLMHSMGLDDDVAISFLLHAWKVLREEKAQAPGDGAAAGQAYVERVRSEPATEAQLQRIQRDVERAGVVGPTRPLTKLEASQVIESLKENRYDPDRWQEEPF